MIFDIGTARMIITDSRDDSDTRIIIILLLLLSLFLYFIFTDDIYVWTRVVIISHYNLATQHWTATNDDVVVNCVLYILLYIYDVEYEKTYWIGSSCSDTKNSHIHIREKSDGLAAWSMYTLENHTRDIKGFVCFDERGEGKTVPNIYTNEIYLVYLYTSPPPNRRWSGDFKIQNVRLKFTLFRCTLII